MKVDLEYNLNMRVKVKLKNDRLIFLGYSSRCQSQISIIARYKNRSGKQQRGVCRGVSRKNRIKHTHLKDNVLFAAIERNYER